MNKYAVGFDFGTTNSTIGIADMKNIKLVELEDGKIQSRTAAYYDVNNNSFTVGDEAISQFKNAPDGRLFQSVKSALNTIVEIKTLLRPGKPISISQIVEIVAKEYKTRLEAVLQQEVDSVVVGRPVKFHDTDKTRDAIAQERLHKVMKKIGFSNIDFEYEPNAALRSYISSGNHLGKTLIIDIGGGTSDFSVVETGSKGDFNILGNSGVYLGGNDIDRILSNSYFAAYLGKGTEYRSYNKNLMVPGLFYDIISDRKNLHNISTYQNQNKIQGYYAFADDKKKYGRLVEIAQSKVKGYIYLDMVEQAKKDISRNENVHGVASFFTDPFDYDLNRKEFNEIISSRTDKIKNVAAETLQGAGLKPDQIDTIFFTGGTSQIPYIQEEILSLFSHRPQSIYGDTFNAVGYGLTEIAKEKFL